MSEAETGENETEDETRTGNKLECRRCGRKEGLVTRYEINLCRQCFREVARDMGAKKYS
ncbi:30S ribosomal protein S14 [Haladaptatus sp. F3-133]|jgi:small subunit ribosomal protein S14|uniref:Small ribosomal subunit protein uS14 n=1 Tax=Halorutilus salinus TaxID=2487751 RepID=A0A9Q4C3E4_9EURY|nr:30S ribosomal protein S14 [Halorutilus salinus]MCX2818563.1 30S ribosomal protein S14 [Halorutilus salinus]